jgi:hypothetical protein
MECINLQGKAPSIKFHEADNSLKAEEKIPMTDPNFDADELPEAIEGPDEIDSDVLHDIPDPRVSQHMDSQYTPTIIAESQEDKLRKR